MLTDKEPKSTSFDKAFIGEKFIIQAQNEKGMYSLTKAKSIAKENARDVEDSAANFDK